jgi:hypothetical protein
MGKGLAAEATLQRCAFEDDAGSDRYHKRGDTDHNAAFSYQLSAIRREAVGVMWVTCRRESS